MNLHTVHIVYPSQSYVKPLANTPLHPSEAININHAESS
jgi:hypothetical protein